MTDTEKLDYITKLMRTILLTNNGEKGYRPIKNTTRAECFNVLGKIQELLETNKVYFKN